LRVLGILLRHPLAVAAVHIVLVLAMMPGVFRLESDNSPEVFFARDAEAMRHYEEFRRDFGGGKTVRAALAGGGLWTKEGLTWLDDLEKRAASLPGVKGAVGIASFYRWHLLEWPPPNPAAFRSRVLKDFPELFTGLMSADGETVTLLVVLSDMPPQAERELLYGLYELTARPPAGIRAHLSGLPVFHLAMDRSLKKTAGRFLPILVLFAVIFPVVLFRRFRDVVVPFFFVMVNQLFLFGIMGYAGVRLNLVNIILAPLLFVICLATAVHILVRFRDETQRGKSGAEAVLATYRGKGKPVLWTGLTTLAAFGSLVTAGLPPLRSVGIWSAVGIVIMTLLAFTLYPLLLIPLKSVQKKQAFETMSEHGKKIGRARGWGRRPLAVRPFERWARRRGRIWAKWAVRYRFPVVVVTSVTLAVGLLGITRCEVEDNFGTYFPPHHPVRLELERLQQQGVGVFAAELLLSYRGNAGDGEETGFLEPSAQQRLAGLSSRLRSHPSIYGAVSSGDFVEATIRSILVEGKVDENLRWMALGLMQTAPESRGLLHAMTASDGRSARVTLLVPMLGFHRMGPVFEWAKAEAEGFFPGAQIWITGQYPLILSAQGRLLRGLVVSLSLTLLCVWVVFFLVVRRVGITLRVLVPNIWPVVVAFGGMGWLGISLDNASVMTAAIVLGLAVDDTFHTLGYFLSRVRGGNAAAVIEETLGRLAPAHILTSVILIAGFAVVSSSDLLPVSRMGGILAVAIALALAGDLILIPALLAGTVDKQKT